MSQTPASLLVDRMTVHNRRLLWELQTINEIAEGISQSLELDDVLTGALQRIVRAFDAVGASIRLRDERTGRYEMTAAVGPARVQRFWNGPASWPSEQVIATRTAVVVEDLAPGVSAVNRSEFMMRSGISLPLLAADELLGVLSVGASSPSRFDLADERLLAIIAGQIVVAVQNARLHDSVRRGKQEWERTFDAISDPIAVFDRHGRLLRGNTALAALLGRRVTEIRGVTCAEVGLCGGGCPDCAIGRALAHDGVPQRLDAASGFAEGTLARAERAEITLADEQILSVTTFPAVDPGAPGASVVQIAKNVTEEIRSARRLRHMSDELSKTNAQLTATVDRLKSTQAQLLQAEKLSAIGQLVAGVAHELNNPLTSVIGFAQLLESELRSGDPARPAEEVGLDLRRIAEESSRAASIVRNLLAFARRQSAARAPQDVTDLVQRVLALRTYEFRLSSVELVTEFVGALPPVIADGSQLQQALLNLILNAERAMRGRATRRLTVGTRLDPRAAAVELFVTDTGHGIDHENMGRIFDPFFTTREVGEGTGLGLSICYGIVRDHGGQIAVSSKVQVGTTFSILLPARIEPPADADAGVLVSHVDQSDRDFIAAALAAWGYRISSTDRADEALERYRRGAMRVAFVDRRILAANLDAWRAAAAAPDATPVPIVVLSTAAHEGEIHQFGHEHVSALLVPPFQLRALRAALAAVILDRVGGA
jgi:two-component system NtrC family sensor kinase